ncbi:hypothetical protein IV454_13505 [Massilia antarctica]|uniref:Uncharacterized protein n=1 Tax=Massilia antarctica TaxID=2765360 RepID=A0AA48WHD0_9BURK|nr:hypothetical protein [Massilia antarctica]QPI52406.1 hypothetical protein IV454_13505 [Massilia antarctica]
MPHADQIQQAPPDITVGFSCTAEERDSLLKVRAGAQAIHPELVEAGKVRKLSAYKRFWNLDTKQQFREQLVETLVAEWRTTHGPEKAETARLLFVRLTSELDQRGAVIFGSLIDNEAFRGLVDEYTRINNSLGSQSWIHSYINLGNHLDFLGNPAFSGAFLHPLLVAMVSCQIGGPLRIVDARGKDAEPISVLAQDNMLHIDNTPFNDEYKVILTWERGQASGPKGQNFVIIPGTHQGLRNCFVNEQGEAWSTENASVFTSDQKIEQAFDIQSKVFGHPSAAVVEIKHENKPLTTVFASGSLVHHRYRTEGGRPRSCLTVCFRGVDNPGQFVDTKHLGDIVEDHALNRFLFGFHDKNSGADFIAAFADRADEIFEKLKDLSLQWNGAEIVDQRTRELSGPELETWKALCTRAPTVETLKARENLFKVDECLALPQFMDLIEKLMIFDKHGPLDLILYEDSHEEIRKWARNQIREMKFDSLKKRLATWSHLVYQPAREDALAPLALKVLAEEVAGYALRSMQGDEKAVLGESEKISARDAYRSLWQLLLDLGEAILRCETNQDFLSTSLFIFWAVDTLDILQQHAHKAVQAAGVKLLANYIATTILVEMQRNAK